MIRHALCGVPTAAFRDGLPWCSSCGVWLVQDETSQEWLSFAELEHRRRSADNAIRIAASAAHVVAGVRHLDGHLPGGWRAAARQLMPGALHTIAVVPPAGNGQVVADLCPPTAERGWSVHIHNRARGVGFPIYAPGGAQVASFATATDALDSAVHAALAEIAAL